MSKSQILMMPVRTSKSRQFVAASSQSLLYTAVIVPGAGAFSAGGWIWLDSLAATRAVISTGGSNTFPGFCLHVNNNNRVVCFARGTDNTLVTTPDSGTAVAAGSWYHAAMVTTRGGSGTMKCYLNGTEVSTVSAASLDTIATASVKRIGAFGSASYLWNGRLARVFYAAQALDSTDLAALIAGAPTFARLNAVAAATAAKMTHFWDLNGTGTENDRVGTNHAAEANGPLARTGGP